MVLSKFIFAIFKVELKHTLILPIQVILSLQFTAPAAAPAGKANRIMAII